MINLSALLATPWRFVFCTLLVAPILLTITPFPGPPEVNHWLWSEQGPVEIGQVLILLAAAGVGAVTLAVRGRIATARHEGLGLHVLAIGGLALLCGLIAGEESSWGQHFIGWSTPASWSELNDQHETNLHNVSSWADQKPRAIIELGVIVFGIVWPLSEGIASRRVPMAWQQLLPPKFVLPVALCAEGARLLERIPKLIGAGGWNTFARPSELQELYFYLFFAICLLTWRGRLLSRLAGTDARAITLSIAEPESRRRAA